MELGLTVGNFDRLNGNVSIDGALGESLFGSLSYHSANSDGWSESLTTGRDFHDDDRQLVRASLEWAPPSGLQAYVSADSLSDQGTGGNQVLQAISNTPILEFYNTALGDQGFATYSEAWVPADIHESYAGRPSFGPAFVDGEALGATLDLSYAAGDWLFRSLTGYREVDYTTSGDGDASPVRVAEVLSNERQDSGRSSSSRALPSARTGPSEPSTSASVQRAGSRSDLRAARRAELLL